MATNGSNGTTREHLRCGGKASEGKGEVVS